MNSLGLDKDPAATRVVVAMSGGVDSSAAAGWLVDQGYRVIGATLQLYDHGAAVGRPGSCCAARDIHDARRIAARLDIPHHVFDFEHDFHRDVIAPFADSYARGETPIPCALCNQTVKFRDLMAIAGRLEADLLVTGHYARWRPGPALLRGRDPVRDQSYFLYGTTLDQLRVLRFPLGDQPKDATRALARRLGLEVADKPDSQDICFVPQGHYSDLVRRLRPDADRPGPIVDLDGRTLGRHRGIVHYTIGQRRGLGIGGTAAPLHVVRLDAEHNTVVVGPREALAVTELTLREVNWLDAALPEDWAVTVKVRSTAPDTPARISAEGWRVTLDPPQYGVAPGQACVVYDGDRVLGGGWIAGTG